MYKGGEKTNFLYPELSYKIIGSLYYVPVKFQDKIIGKYYLDFLIEDKIVLELKRGKYTSLGVINQTKQYLKALNLKLGIIACFATDAVITKRILNIY